MEVFSKELKATDVGAKLSFPTHGLEHLDFAGSNSVDLRVKDSCGELRVIRCWKRKNGDHDKPVLSSGWLKFVADYGLGVGDKVVLLARMTIAWVTVQDRSSRKIVLLVGSLVFSKELRATDVGVKLSFPTHGLEHLDFAGSNSVDLRVKDSCGELRVIRCWKRKNGDHDKPVLSSGWLKFVADYGLELVTSLGSQFRIEALRKIVLLGQKAWGIQQSVKTTDVGAKLSFPTHGLEHLDFAGSNSVDLRVKDSCGELRVIRCWKRKNGDHDKPVLSSGWLKFVADYGLGVGDKVVLLREDDHNLGSQFRIEAQRRIVLLGRKDWGEVTRATNY
uniref:TF-B3 domain-containing protein n=1 Tax=Salix viminalis TaxID=40686 RepID=A0A6N2K8C9_SALVM